MSLKTYPGLERQKGMGFVGYLVVLGVAVFIGLFAIKVVPQYFQNWTVTKVANDLVAAPEVLKQPRSRVYKYINDAYRTNNLWELTGEETILLERDKQKGYIVTVKYEQRTNLFRNIDLVTTFDKKAN